MFHLIKQRRTREYMATIEEKVQQYLVNNGITQVFFADLIGISTANVAAMFKGKRRMKADELIKFCEHYGLNIDFFKEQKTALQRCL